jgi:ribosome biogenesis protein ENP2
MSVGNAVGKVSVYDLRNPKPMYTINHSYRLPIKKIKFHEHSQNIITVDRKIAKFSNMKTGKAFTNIETKHDINDFETFKDSGMFFFANESEKMDIYFVPGIGPAPKWASFLENITEELEEAKNYSVYEDYKFLTMTDLEQLGATNLIGTNFIKPYMHGYFMDWKLYKKLKSVSDPFAYDKYLEERKQEKFNKLFGERIILNRNKKVKVNNKLLENIDNNDKKEGAGLIQNVVNDSRFEKLFKDKDFEIDFKSEHFKNSLVASGKVKNKNQSSLLEEFDDIKFEEEGDEKKLSSNQNKIEKIVNPELIKLKEKLLSKKRKKIENLYGNTEEDLEKSLQNRIQNEEEEEADHVIESRINKIERKIKTNEEYRKKIKPKITSNKIDGSQGKRLLASSNKLTLTKFR